ncbi:MAG: MBL fold metallo-hydrolase [Candidatus Acetothermia bacterium]|jgi:L-ascorbate metabolism protein UlaG (beta-lactamase superfamily)|nr:MBL fold metallo-hydrolase [Candidatus Acetothermia bacterium]
MAREFQTDRIETSGGELAITFLGHGSLLFAYDGKRVYLDPFSRVADYAALPKADLVLITHEHRDHLDPEALALVCTPATQVVVPARCTEKVPGGTVMGNGDKAVVLGLALEAVPAYNLVHRRENGEPFHRRGEGNGYVITFGDVRVLVAGDTENTPELKALRGIDVAFLPMNVPYTMTPEMVADVAVALRPRILYPYHYGSTDPTRLVALLGGHPEIEVRIRSLA